MNKSFYSVQLFRNVVHAISTGKYGKKMHKFINYCVSKMKMNSNVSDSEDYCLRSIAFTSEDSALFISKMSLSIYDMYTIT